MINIQNFYSVHFGYIWSTLVTLVLFYPPQFYSVHIGPILSILSTSVLFSLIWSNLVLFGSICSIQSIMFTLVLICQFVLIRSTSVPFNLIQSTVLFSPFRSTLFSFGHILPIRSICIYFNSFFCTYIQGKDMLGLRMTILNSNLLKYIYIHVYIYLNFKIVISKIINMVLINATLLLSHINVVFQSTLVMLNLSERIYKPNTPFGLRGREGEQSKVEQNVPKISQLYSILLHSPSLPSNSNGP